MIYKEAKTEYERARIRSAFMFARALQESTTKLLKYFEGTYGDPGAANLCMAHAINAKEYLNDALAARMALFEQKRAITKVANAVEKIQIDWDAVKSKKITSIEEVARKHR
jgi:hypothetical protein